MIDGGVFSIEVSPPTWLSLACFRLTTIQPEQTRSCPENNLKLFGTRAHFCPPSWEHSGTGRNTWGCNRIRSVLNLSHMILAHLCSYMTALFLFLNFSFHQVWTVWFSWKQGWAKKYRNKIIYIYNAFLYMQKENGIFVADISLGPSSSSDSMEVWYTEVLLACVLTASLDTPKAWWRNLLLSLILRVHTPVCLLLTSGSLAFKIITNCLSL